MSHYKGLAVASLFRENALGQRTPLGPSRGRSVPDRDEHRQTSRAIARQERHSSGLLAVRSPNLSEVFQKALTEYRPATDWPAVEVAGLTRNPRGKIAVVGHQSLTVLSLIIFLVRRMPLRSRRSRSFVTHSSGRAVSSRCRAITMTHSRRVDEFVHGGARH